MNESKTTQSAQALETAGFNFSTLSPEQQQIMNSLSPDEVRILISVKERLDAAADVQAYGAVSRDTGPSYGIL